MVDNILVERLAKESIHDRPFPDARFPPSVYYRFLKRLAEYRRPVVSVELGCCGGGASLHMALGNPDGDVFGVDITNDYPDNILFVESLCSNFHFVLGDSIAIAQDWLVGDVDILFIDTIHTYARTMAEFEAWRPHLSQGAILVLDDLYRDGMDIAWRDLPGKKVRLDYLHIGGSPTDGGFGCVLL